MGQIRLLELYTSVQGEGPNVGVPTTFVRFAGCNLRCPGWPCDTPYSTDPKIWRKEITTATPSDIMTLIQDKYPKHVCITGGEPLLQPSGEMNLLLTLLDYADYTVDIFTNGTIDLSPIIQLPFTIVMDWKLQGSGEGNTLLEQRKSNRKLLRTYDVVKFVVADEADLEEMLALITEWETAHQKVSLGTDRWLTWHQLAVTPAWGRMEPHLVVEFLEAHQLKDVRLSLQVHKYVWHPKQRRI